MSNMSNFIMKKNLAIGGKPKKKSIPININSNPAPGKMFVSNQVNHIASSYLSMGQRIQISKNLKNAKHIQVNTNSGINYYNLSNKDSKQAISSGTNSYLNNFQNNNNSDNYGINFNNYFNSNSNNNHSQQHYDMISTDKNPIKFNNINVNVKARKHLSTIYNSLYTNEIFINGFQTTKNNNISNNNLLSNNKPQNKVISVNSKNNVSKIKNNYSTRPNFLDSRNKTKKVPMKSKIRQYKFQFKVGKPSSSSFSNVHMPKNNLQGIASRDIYIYQRGDKLNNITSEGNYDNILLKNNTNGNFIIKNNLYEIKNKHFRNNTASFDNKDILNIFNSKALSNKSTKNINNLNINDLHNIGVKSNNYNNICINNIDANNKNSNLDSNLNLYINKNNLNNESMAPSSQIINKANNTNFIRKSNQFSKGKINNIKIYINEKKININQKENKYNPNINNNNNPNSFYNNINNKNIYHHYNINSNNIIKDNYSNMIHMKNHSINNNIPGIKKISVKQKEIKNNIVQNRKPINKAIPAPNQKVKGNIIPSQRNIKLNMSKILNDVKTNKDNKFVMARKSISIKKIAKENNSDFSVSQINDKFSKKILKNEEENDIGSYANNNNKNIDKITQEEVKTELNKEEKNNYNNNDIGIDNNILIDTNYISNVENKDIINRISSVQNKEISQNKMIKDENNSSNYYKINYKTNTNTTNGTNNNHSGYIKNEYSKDNIPDLIKESKAFIKNKENINNININKNINNQPNAIKHNINKEEIIKENSNETENNKEKNINNYILNDSNKKNCFEELEDRRKSKIDIIKDNKLNLKQNKITNSLFDEDNLDELPEDYDENFNDLYSIINKMTFGNILVVVEGLFTPEGKSYKKFREKFDKNYDKLFNKKRNSFANSNNKQNKMTEGIALTSNTKTNSSSSKKDIANIIYNDLNIVKELNAY